MLGKFVLNYFYIMWDFGLVLFNVYFNVVVLFFLIENEFGLFDVMFGLFIRSEIIDEKIIYWFIICKNLIVI